MKLFKLNKSTLVLVAKANILMDRKICSTIFFFLTIRQNILVMMSRTAKSGTDIQLSNIYSVAGAFLQTAAMLNNYLGV